MSNEAITIEEFKAAMPTHVRKSINPAVMALVNKGINDPEVLAVYRENVIGLTTVMREGKFKIADYLNAVQFVSHVLLGDTQIQSWSKVFPQRYKDMVNRGNTRSEIASICSRYSSTKIVTLLMGQTMMPTHILNAPLFQKAINTQADLMLNAKSEMVRMHAASNLIATLKPPEVQKVELSVGMKEDETIMALRESTRELVRQQKAMIEAGVVSVKSIAQSKLIGSGPIEEGIVGG